MSSFKNALEFLLAPTTADEFFARYWETLPLFVSRRAPERYRQLLPAEDLDHLISMACRLQNSTVELLGESSVVSESEAQFGKRVATVYEAYRRGATIRVNGVQQLWKPLQLLCRELEQELSFPVKANLYATPASAHRSPRHYDKHDVLVLQLSGRKHWRVYNPVFSLPLAFVPPLPFEERGYEPKSHRGGPLKGRADIDDEECGAPIQELVLEAGDTLYLPRGFVHEAWTADEESVHVTVGLHCVTWMHLLSVALGQASNRDERLRRALPVGYAKETANLDALEESFNALLRVFTESASLKESIEETAWSFVVNMQAVGEGALTAPDRPEEIGLQTLLRRRRGLLCRLVREAGNVGLASSNNVFWMPASFAEALRFVVHTPEFHVAELPGQMSDNSKLVLARRLVQEGFLTSAEARVI